MRITTQIVTILFIVASYCGEFQTSYMQRYSVFKSETRKFKMILYPLISTELTQGQGCVGGGGSCDADSECCSKRCQRISFNNYRCEFGNLGMVV